MEEPTLAPPRSRPASFPLPLHRAWLTQGILVLNIVLFVLLTLATVFLEPRYNLIEAVLSGAPAGLLVLFGAKANTYIRAGEYWRLLAPIFLHIGLVHLLFNQYALMLFGKEVEQLFGTLRFAIIYLIAGLFGSVASFAFSPSVSAGASGAIFGIIGALAAFFLRNREIFGDRGREQLRGLLGLIVVNLVLGVTIPGIDNWGHMGGLVAGAVLGAALAPTYALRRIPAPPFGEIVEQRPPFAPPLVGLVALLAFVGALVVALPLSP